MANAVETPSQNNLMTEGSIVKSLLLFALPLIFGNLLHWTRTGKGSTGIFSTAAATEIGRASCRERV